MLICEKRKVKNIFFSPLQTERRKILVFFGGENSFSEFEKQQF